MTFNLASAIKSAAPGDTISLPDGVYGDLTLKKSVRLVGGKGALFRSVTVLASSVYLEGFSVACVPNLIAGSPTSGVRVVSVGGFHANGLTVSCGSALVGVAPDSDPNLPRPGDNVIGWPTGTGIELNWADGAIVENCDVSKAFAGIGFADAKGLRLTGNTIHDVRTSMIHGSALGDIEIVGNVLTKSNPWGYGGNADHADFIHAWTDPAKASGPVNHVVISDNLMDQGTGFPIMGPYLDDNNKGIGFTDVLLSGNVLLSGHAQGFLLENVKGDVRDNVLLMVSGDPAHNAPSIRAIAGSVVTCERNIAHDIYKTLAAQPAANGNIIVPVGIQPALVQALARARIANLGSA